jgi:hypothetical protein
MPGRVRLQSPAVLFAAGTALLVLLIVLVRGCGGGDDALSAEELRARASVICVRVTEATDRVAVPNAPAGGARFLAEGAELMRPAVRQLGELEPPEELRERYDAAVAMAAREVEMIARAERQIRADGAVISEFRALQRTLGPLVERENAAWRALGIRACVRR